jgi:hypothetical protein
MTLKSPMTLGMLAMFCCACAPKPIAYIKIGHPGSEGILLEDVALVYSHEEAPKGAQVIAHIKETSNSMDCEQAALAALVQMQKKAAAQGGNAIINIKNATKGDIPPSTSEGFFCGRASSLEEGSGDVTVKVWSITWEGDIARTAEEASGDGDL